MKKEYTTAKWMVIFVAIMAGPFFLSMDFFAVKRETNGTIIGLYSIMTVFLFMNLELFREANKNYAKLEEEFGDAKRFQLFIMKDVPTTQDIINQGMTNLASKVQEAYAREDSCRALLRKEEFEDTTTAKQKMSSATESLVFAIKQFRRYRDLAQANNFMAHEHFETYINKEKV